MYRRRSERGNYDDSIACGRGRSLRCPACDSRRRGLHLLPARLRDCMGSGAVSVVSAARSCRPALPLTGSIDYDARRLVKRYKARDNEIWSTAGHGHLAAVIRPVGGDLNRETSRLARLCANELNKDADRTATSLHNRIDRKSKE